MISYRPTFMRIVKNKSVEEFVPDPYIACVMNCLLWIFYGLPFNHPNSTLVITINGIGLGMELIYLTIFLIYGNKNHRVCTFDHIWFQVINFIYLMKFVNLIYLSTDEDCFLYTSRNYCPYGYCIF